jgi:hypothetical protein
MANDMAKVAGLKALQSAFDELSGQMDTSEAYAVGTPIDYGRYLEEGTSRMPPYPWLQPAVDETVRDGTRIAQQSGTVDALIRIAALDIESNARRILEGKGNRPYQQSGTLQGSIEAVPMD